MIRVINFIYFSLISLKIIAVHYVVYPEKEKIFVISDARSKRSGYISILQSLFHLIISIRNGGIIKITTDYSALCTLRLNIILYLIYLLSSHTISTTQTISYVSCHSF